MKVLCDSRGQPLKTLLDVWWEGLAPECWSSDIFIPTVFPTLALVRACLKEEGIHRKPEPRNKVGCLLRY